MKRPTSSSAAPGATSARAPIRQSFPNPRRRWRRDVSQTDESRPAGNGTANQSNNSSAGQLTASVAPVAQRGDTRATSYATTGISQNSPAVAPVAPVAPYANSAWPYRRAGWPGAIPIGRRAAQKSPPPTGYTGWAGRDPSGADVQAWIDGREGALNIGLHIPEGVYVPDFDVEGRRE